VKLALEKKDGAEELIQKYAEVEVNTTGVLGVSRK
jgi:hypothetical protein